MVNFFTDNQDIQFLFDYFDLKDIAALQERETPNGDADYLPRSIDDVIDNYHNVLMIVGDISGNILAKNAETVDAEGNTLNADQTVTLHPLVQKNLDKMRLLICKVLHSRANMAVSTVRPLFLRWLRKLSHAATVPS